jgi:hypothetical protein
MDNQPIDEAELVNQYIKSLNKDQLKIIEIAKKELGTSYDVTKCNGFIKFKKNLHSLIK